MGKYILSPQAQLSLRNIKRYTSEKFGEAQTKPYLEQLRHALQSVADNPLNGLDRSDIKPGYYSKSLNSHVIFYRKNNNHIDIIDVLQHRLCDRGRLSTRRQNGPVEVTLSMATICTRGR